MDSMRLMRMCNRCHQGSLEGNYNDTCPLCGIGTLGNRMFPPTEAELEAARRQRARDDKKNEQYDKRMMQEPVEREIERTYSQRLEEGFEMVKAGKI